MFPTYSRLVRAAAFVTVLASAVLAADRSFAQERTGLSGTWILDEARSDDPGAAVEKADHGGTIGRVIRSTSGTVVIGGIPIPELPRSEERSKPRSHDSPSLVKSGHVLSVVDRLTIDQDAQLTEMVYDTLKAAAYENGIELETGYSTIIATWNGERMVVEHVLASSAAITETYELDGDRLHWDVRVKSKGIRTIRISRVYERAGAAGLNLVAQHARP